MKISVKQKSEGVFFLLWCAVFAFDWDLRANLLSSQIKSAAGGRPPRVSEVRSAKTRMLFVVGEARILLSCLLSHVWSISVVRREGVAAKSARVS
jgi:hypothetical protein